MPIPLLVAAAAFIGAKKGAKEAAEQSQQNESSLQQGLNRPTYADVSILNKQKQAIDFLLSFNPQYRVFEDLRSFIQNNQIKINFYALVLQEDRLRAFFENYPTFNPLLLNRILGCINNFLSDVDSTLKNKNPSQQRLIPVDPRYKKLYAINIAASEEIKMHLLQIIGKDKQTIGHLCLEPHGKYNRWYKNILCSLQTHNLFNILKCADQQNQTIFALYCKVGLNACDLLSGCKKDPKVFCDMIEYFQIDNQTIQSLANVFGLKKTIRTYLLNLPDTQTTWDLLDRCLNPETSIGNFCAKEANRFGLFQQGNIRETVLAIRTKINARIVLVTEALVEPVTVVTVAPLAPSPIDEIVTHRPFLHNTSQSKAIEWVPAVNKSSEFWLYTTCATAIIAVGIAFLYAYLNTDVSTEAQNRLN
jgi:hypothetical protein